jgi:LEA14-like dessication related protein
LPPAIYNVPLTIRSTVPASWVQVVVQQGNATQTITPVIEGNDRVIYYNAVPNGGDIVLIPLNPALELTSLNPTSAIVGGSSFTLTVTGANFVNGSVVRWNDSDRTTTYVSATQLTASIPASDIASISTANVKVINPVPGGTSNQLYFEITAKPITITVNPGQSKVYGDTDPFFTYTSSDPLATLTGALSRIPGENVDTYAINQGTLAVVSSNYAITSFVPANFAVTPKPITITANTGQSKAHGDVDPVFMFTSSDSGAAFAGALSRVSGENVGTYAINQGTLAVAGNNYTITSFVSANFTITPSTNANLSSLVFSTGMLTPTFASGTTTYAQSVPYATTSLTVTPTAADTTATIKVNGATITSGSTSSPVVLAVGSNTITTIVTAGDGLTTKTYTVTVIRAAPSTNADLSGLVLSTGTLNPTFASGTTTYTQSVPYTVTGLTVIPTVADATATIKINGVTVSSGSASGAIALAVGSNTISILVTAQDSTVTKSYTITVTRRPSTNANLSNLTFSTGTLAPTFASGTTAYTQSVVNDITDLTVTPTVADTTATIKINGVIVASGNTTVPILLVVGNNIFNIVITAQDGITTKTYTVTVTRAPDRTAPSITYITRASPNPTSSSSVDFRVAFSEDVTGVDTSDFNLTVHGVTGDYITNVTGSGPTYIVTVKTGLGKGTIRLDVVDNNSIMDTSSNSLGGSAIGDGSFDNGEIYTVIPSDYKLFLPLLLR